MYVEYVALRLLKEERDKNAQISVSSPVLMGTTVPTDAFPSTINCF